MIGIPGSGKSTWIRRYASTLADHYLVVSRDEIRFSLLQEDEPYFAREREVYSEFIKQIKIGIANYKDVIVDATHLNPASRKKLINSLKPFLEKIYLRGIFITVPVEVAIERDSHRTGRSHVGETVIRRMYQDLIPPSFAEGFNSIYTFENDSPLFSRCVSIKVRGEVK
jgi:predicted kinase